MNAADPPRETTGMRPVVAQVPHRRRTRAPDGPGALEAQQAAWRALWRILLGPRERQDAPDAALERGEALATGGGS